MKCSILCTGMAAMLLFSETCVYMEVGRLKLCYLQALAWRRESGGDRPHGCHCVRGTAAGQPGVQRAVGRCRSTTFSHSMRTCARDVHSAHLARIQALSMQPVYHSAACWLQ